MHRQQEKAWGMEAGVLDQSWLTQEHLSNCTNILWPEARIRLTDVQNLLIFVQKSTDKHNSQETEVKISAKTVKD